MGILLLGTPQVLASGFRPLKLGASGFITGGTFVSDGAGGTARAVRTDSWGGYRWNPAALTPVGNAGGSGAWEQLITSQSMPAKLVSIIQEYNHGIYELKYAPSNSSILYMMWQKVERDLFPARMQLYVSSDGGLTFTETGFATAVSQSIYTPNNAYDSQDYKWWGQKMAVHPTNSSIVLVGTPQNGLWYTQDGGATFAQVSTSQVPLSTAGKNGDFPGISGIRFQPGTPNTIYAASFGNGTYKCTSGVTSAAWTKITSSGVGPVSVRQSDISSNGVYYVTDDDNSSGPNGGNIWTWDGAWHKRTTDSLAYGIAVDPFNAARAVAMNYSDGIAGHGSRLNECNNDGVTFNGWTLAGSFTSADIPFMAVSFTPDAYALHFDQGTAGKLWVTGDRGVSTANVTLGSITTGTSVAWADSSVGIEELVVVDVIYPPGGTPITTTWDTAAFRRPVANFDTYPSANYKINSLSAGWSIDYACNDSNFIGLHADGFYAGGAVDHAFSTDGGQNWTGFTPPYGSKSGGIAVSTSTSALWYGGQGRQPYYTTNFGASPTWHPVDLSASGVPNEYVISSGTYNSATGQVVLTLATTPSFVSGHAIGVYNLTATGAGAGNIVSLTVDNTTATAVSGNTVTYAGQASLGALTITGGFLADKASGTWGNFGSAFYANGSRWMVADKVNTGQFTLMLGGVGLFNTTNGGAAWTKFTNASAGGNIGPYIKSVPGQANNIWWSEGRNGNPGELPTPVNLRYSQNAGSTWTVVSNAYSAVMLGFGKAAPGQSYPAVYMTGYVSAASSSTITVPTSGNVPINFTIAAGMGIIPNNGSIVGTSVFIDGGSGNKIWGLISAYNNATGAATMVPYFYSGSGSISSLTVVMYGLWRTIAGPSATPAWTQLCAWPGQYGVSIDTVDAMTGSMDTYGLLLMGSGATGFVYAQFN